MKIPWGIDGEPMILLGHRMCCVLGCLRCFENRQACEASLRRLKTDYIASWKSQRMFAWVLGIVIACACIFLYLWFICCIWFSISLYLDGSATIATRCDKLCTLSIRANLKSDKDLYQIHWPDRYVPIFGGTLYKPSNEREAVKIEAGPYHQWL